MFIEFFKKPEKGRRKREQKCSRLLVYCSSVPIARSQEPGSQCVSFT